MAVGALALSELAPGRPLGLLFLYETDEGKSEGARGLSPSLELHTFFQRFFGALTRALGDAGFVLDLDRRPEGQVGPLCNSLEAFSDYLERFGGPTERRVFVRLAPVAGDPVFGELVVQELAPFVYRRSLEAALISALRQLDPDRLTVADLVDTLAAGLGGRHTGLKMGSTAVRLAELARLRLLDPTDATRLAALHDAELDGLPSPEHELLRGLVSGLSVVTTATSHPTRDGIAVALDTKAPTAERVAALEALGFVAADAARERIDALSRIPEGPFYRQSGRDGALAPALLLAASQTPAPDQVLLACEALSHLLKHQPHTHEQLARDTARLARLVNLFASDRAATRHLLASPELFVRLVIEGLDEGPGARIALEDPSTARLDEHTRAAFFGRPPTDSADTDVAITVALACELAGVSTADELPFLLLARASDRGLDLDMLLPDEADAALRALPRRLITALTAGPNGPLVELRDRPGRRPFTTSELRRHLADGGHAPRWKVVAGAEMLIDALRGLQNAVLAESAPA